MHLLNRMATTSAYPKLPACLPHPPRSHDMAFAGRQQCKWREGVICNLYFLVNKIENLESTVEQKTKKKTKQDELLYCYTETVNMNVNSFISVFNYFSASCCIELAGPMCNRIVVAAAELCLMSIFSRTRQQPAAQK